MCSQLIFCGAGCPNMNMMYLSQFQSVKEYTATVPALCCAELCPGFKQHSLSKRRAFLFHSMPNSFRCSSQSSGKPLRSLNNVSFAGSSCPAVAFCEGRMPLRMASMMSGARLTRLNARKRKAHFCLTFCVRSMENTFILPELFLAGNFLFRIIPMQTDSDSDQEHLQQAFERYGTTRKIPFS